MPNKETNDNVSRVVAEFFKKKPQSGNTSRNFNRRPSEVRKHSEPRKPFANAENTDGTVSADNERTNAPVPDKRGASIERNGEGGYRNRPRKNAKTQAVSSGNADDANASGTAERTEAAERRPFRKNRRDRGFDGTRRNRQGNPASEAQSNAAHEDHDEAAAQELDAADSRMSDSLTDYDPEANTEIVGVSFKQGGKIYFFAPGELKLSRGDTVIVETSRGLEYGFVQTPNSTVKAREIISTLKTVVRPATAEDTAHYEDNNRRVAEAMKICSERIAFRGLDMKLVDVEYTFDNSKLLFYFTSDARVDFRELVKDLAGIFKTRIELRQIGIREETKLIGGLGICGRPFCCKSFLNDFVQVSIKMAKEQGLSLNSAKISGACGRLMCCLRYEYETYEDEIRRTPKCDTPVMTPDGPGVVCETQPLAGLCKVRLTKDGETVINVYHRDDLKRREANE